VAFDVLVLGDAKPDLLVPRVPDVVFGGGERLVGRARLALGGSGAIAACGAARLGRSVAFAGVVGDDALGRFVTEELRAHDVDVTAVVAEPETATGVSVVLTREEEEAVLTAVGSVARLEPSMIDEGLLASVRHVHVASYYLQDALRGGVADLFAVAHDHGVSTSIDPNRDPSGEWDGGLLDLLSMTDVLFVNSVEVRGITGMDDIDVAAQALAERGAVVAVKFAHGGGLAMWGDEVVRSEALPTEVVDTTGAGASFAAGFLVGRLDGWSIDRSLALAVACGSLSASAVGGTAGQPTMPEAVAALGETS